MHLHAFKILGLHYLSLWPYSEQLPVLSRLQHMLPFAVLLRHSVALSLPCV
jgi:hypothetical protein